jgi:hypothetical protein
MLSDEPMSSLGRHEYAIRDAVPHQYKGLVWRTEYESAILWSSHVGAGIDIALSESAPLSLQGAVTLVVPLNGGLDHARLRVEESLRLRYQLGVMFNF